jgi:hypothetical protein
MRKRIVLALLAGAIALMTVTAPSYAQTTAFSVKFVCGTQHPDPSLVAPSEPPVKPGNYATVINLQALTGNQSLLSTFVASKISTTFSGFGVVVQGPTHNLFQFGTADITCADIDAALAGFNGVTPFLTGWVTVLVATTATPFSVSAVYTSQGCFFPPFNTAAICAGPTSIEVVPQQGQAITFPAPAPS